MAEVLAETTIPIIAGMTGTQATVEEGLTMVMGLVISGPAAGVQCQILV